MTEKQSSSNELSIEDVKVEIDESLEATLSKLYKKYGIRTGDISPMQLIEWDRCVDKVSKLFGELIESNSDIKILKD